MKWLKRYSIKVKLIVAIMGVCLMLIGLMAGISQYFYETAARKDFFRFAEDAADRLNGQLDLYIEQMKLSTSFLIAGPLPFRSELIYDTGRVGLIQRWLRNELVHSADLRDVEDMLNNYLALNYAEIEAMYLMAWDGRVISNVNSYIDPRQYELEIWYDRPLSEQMEVLPAHDSSISGNNVISILVPFVDLKSMELRGRLVIDVGIDGLKKTMIRSSLAEKGYFFIVAEDGTIVYHHDHSLVGDPIEQTRYAPLSFNQSSSVQFLGGQEMLVAFSESSVTGWKVIAMVPFSDMASGVMIARDSIIAALIVLAFLVVFLAPYAAQRFTRPLRTLKGLMSVVETGNLTVRAAVVPGRDEIQLLNLSFNHMVERLNELMQTVDDLKLNEMKIKLRQKEAIIQALQNQINPHLLYNTLEIIKSIAYLEKNERIETMVRNLGDYYRYTANISERQVTLREELNQLEKYLEIVHIRFPKHFQSKFLVNEKYLDSYIVKCSLQPIVENSVKYAVEANFGKGHINVSAYNDNEMLVIEIADNGSGIPVDKLMALERRLEQISVQTNEKNQDNSSFGIVNVHERLVLQYGNRYGLRLASFPGRGTVVSIYVPFHKKNPDTPA